MILEGVTLQGTMHKEFDVANQDSVRTDQIDDYYIGVVCDGISLKSDRTFSNSEIASEYCASHVIDYLKENLRKHMDAEQTETLMFECFKSTAISLEDELEKRGIPFYDCQTTVLLMMYHKGVLYSAMAGDGGIIFKYYDGAYGLLVTKLKTSSSVEPICYPQGWRFATVEDPANPVTAAILATDGIFDNLTQVFRGEVSLNQPLIQEMFSIEQVHESHKQRALLEIAKRIETHDDKTAVVLIAGADDYPEVSPQSTEDSEEKEEPQESEENQAEQ